VVTTEGSFSFLHPGAGKRRQKPAAAYKQCRRNPIFLFILIT
jgi:hypothetical protein